MTDKDAVTLADELERLIEAARGCEFDLVPSDGPIARIALFMHENGDRIIAALKPAGPALTPDEEAELVERINGNPYLQPAEPAAEIDGLVEIALHAMVPGGAEVWCWLPQKDAWTPSETARDVMRSALLAAYPEITRLQAENARLKALLGEELEHALNAPSWELALTHVHNALATLNGGSDA